MRLGNERRGKERGLFCLAKPEATTPTGDNAMGDNAPDNAMGNNAPDDNAMGEGGMGDNAPNDNATGDQSESSP